RWLGRRLAQPLVRPRLVDVGGVLAPRSGAAAFAEDGPGDHAAIAGRFRPAASRRDAAGVWPTWPCGPPRGPTHRSGPLDTAAHACTIRPGRRTSPVLLPMGCRGPELSQGAHMSGPWPAIEGFLP